MNGRYSKLAFLHRDKERKTPSLSAQASFAPFSLKVLGLENPLLESEPLHHYGDIFQTLNHTSG